MFPISDVIPSRTRPVVTIGLIVINSLVFTTQYALIPAYFTWASVITSMFLHGGWMHVIGNMLYLWIFGDNVEDRLGHFRYLLFYLIAGTAAGITQVALQPASALPTIGASGAIAGVLGAYLVTFPRSRVLTFFPPIWFFELPAFAYLVFWFLLQLLEGFGSLGAPAETGGVAVWAHVGGFVSGVVLIKLMAPQRGRARPMEIGP